MKYFATMCMNIFTNFFVLSEHLGQDRICQHFETCICPTKANIRQVKRGIEGNKVGVYSRLVLHNVCCSAHGKKKKKCICICAVLNVFCLCCDMVRVVHHVGISIGCCTFFFFFFFSQLATKPETPIVCHVFRECVFKTEYLKRNFHGTRSPTQ